MFHRCPSFDFCFEFLVNRTSFLGLFRHFALILDLKMNLMSPAVAIEYIFLRKSDGTIHNHLARMHRSTSLQDKQGPAILNLK